jgi:hypothetical protein
MPIVDSSYHKYKKKLIVKDGAATATDGDIIYATKGGGTEVFWKYTPLVGWERLDRIPIEKIDKKHAPKTGAAMAYADGKVWLLTGNKQPDFWSYVPEAKITKVHSPQTIVGLGLSPASSQANLKVCPTLSVNPNPFSNLTAIRYNVMTSGKVSIKLYNTSGRLIETLLNNNLSIGSYSLKIDNWKLKIPAGVYFIKYENGNQTSETKLIVK